MLENLFKKIAEALKKNSVLENIQSKKMAKILKSNKIKKLKFTTTSTIGDGSYF
jgi:hypothetical protein